MESIVLQANAKVNLTLDVTGRREDGYHLLQMVMQSVSLHDTITLTKRAEPGITLTCSVPGIPCDEKNIAWKSAALFFRHCGLESAGVAIHIEKRIPSQAGLGGGSSDGAAVLVGLNRLFGTELSDETLCALGVQIGADVPFCILGGTRLCEGIGEIMTQLPALPDCTILLCKPELNISTGEAYARIDNGPLAPRPEHPTFLEALSAGDLTTLSSAMCNVFESAIPLPVVNGIKEEMLRCGALGAAMSGSGSTAFGVFADAEKAEACGKILQKTYSEVHLCHPAKTGIVLQ